MVLKMFVNLLVLQNAFGDILLLKHFVGVEVSEFFEVLATTLLSVLEKSLGKSFSLLLFIGVSLWAVFIPLDLVTIIDLLGEFSLSVSKGCLLLLGVTTILLINFIGDCFFGGGVSVCLLLFCSLLLGSLSSSSLSVKGMGNFNGPKSKVVRTANENNGRVEEAK